MFALWIISALIQVNWSNLPSFHSSMILDLTLNLAYQVKLDEKQECVVEKTCWIFYNVMDCLSNLSFEKSMTMEEPSWEHHPAHWNSLGGVQIFHQENLRKICFSTLGEPGKDVFPSGCVWNLDFDVYIFLLWKLKRLKIGSYVWIM